MAPFRKEVETWDRNPSTCSIKTSCSQMPTFDPKHTRSELISHLRRRQGSLQRCLQLEFSPGFVACRVANAKSPPDVDDSVMFNPPISGAQVQGNAS